METSQSLSAAAYVTEKSGRRRYTAELKRQVIELTLAPGASVAAIALAHRLNANLLFKWRRQFLRERGLLPPAPALLPVEIAVSPDSANGIPPSPMAPSSRGAIQVEFRGIRVCISGEVDPVALRTVLSSLPLR